MRRKSMTVCIIFIEQSDKRQRQEDRQRGTEKDSRGVGLDSCVVCLLCCSN